MIAAFWITVVALQTYSPQSELPREVLVLARAKQKVRDVLDRMPDYTCLQTVERFARRSDRRPFEALDTVRLEVGLVDNKEVFSWPGADSFSEGGAIDLVGAGTVSHGEFAQRLRAVFAGVSARITWHGEDEFAGRKALRYDFQLPLTAHRWQVNLAGTTGDVAAHGSFWVDANTLDLVRLESRAAEIPPGLPLQEMISRVDYGRMRIRDRDVWLPQSAELLLVDLSGRQNRNLIEFSHCRQYLGNSRISFEETASVPRDARTPPQKAVVPAGVTLSLRLDTEIDSTTSSVGDLISARLDADAIAKGAIVVPKGALVKGRIRRLEKSAEVSAHFVVGLEFHEIEFDQRRAMFFGRLQSIQDIPGLSQTLGSSTSKTQRTMGYTRTTTTSERLYARELAGVGTFFMSGSRIRVPAGLKMIWETIALPEQTR